MKNCACREPVRPILRPRVRAAGARPILRPRVMRGASGLQIGSTLTLPAGWTVGAGRLRRDTVVTITRVDTSSDGILMYGVKWTDGGKERTSWIGHDEAVSLASSPPRVMREVAEHGHRVRGTEPIVLTGSPGSKCRPFLTVHKDDEKFAACNALADEIGPLNDPKKVFRLLEEAIGDEHNEVFVVMTVDLHGRLKGMTETGRGEASSVMAPMLPTLRAALLSGGGGAILAHVHPSGIEAKPSKADDDTTEAFAEAFETIGMPLLDHCILGGDVRKRSYFSYAEQGLL